MGTDLTPKANFCLRAEPTSPSKFCRRTPVPTAQMCSWKIPSLCRETKDFLGNFSVSFFFFFILYFINYRLQTQFPSTYAKKLFPSVNIIHTSLKCKLSWGFLFVCFILKSWSNRLLSLFFKIFGTTCFQNFVEETVKPLFWKTGCTRTFSQPDFFSISEFVRSLFYKNKS